MPDLDDDDLLERVRADMVMTRVHFNHAGMSPTPAPARAAMLGHLAREAEVGGYEAAADATDALGAVPAAVAPLFGPTVDADEVAIAESATRAWETALWTLAETFRYGPGDRVLLDRFTYGTTYTMVERLRVARGVSVEVVSSNDDGTVDVNQLARLLDSATRLVAITHMPTHLGTRTDVAAVGRVLQGTGVVFALDVAQTLGQMPIDVKAIGSQVAFAPGRKFLRAPRGTGLLYVDADLAETLVPVNPGFGVVGPVAPGRFTWPSAARRFDSFEYGHAARLGLGEAARYATAIGLDRIEQLVAARSRDVTDVLAGIEGVRLLAPPDAVGIISFQHDEHAPADVQARLADAGVNVWVNPPAGAPFDARARPVLPSVRVSPHYCTDAVDLAALGEALSRL
jgi:cysteine desulfurase/selenocysteine lyase